MKKKLPVETLKTLKIFFSTYSSLGTNTKHGPPHGPGPWTTMAHATTWTWSMDHPYFSKGNCPCQFYMKIYRRSGYEKQRFLFIAYILEGLSRKSVLFWDRGPMNGKTTNSF